MDKRKIIKEKLYPIFCEINKNRKRYAEVWLSFADFGKMYFTDELYELKVKMFPGVKRSSDELREIIEVLNQKAKEEFKPVWVVKIIGADEFKHCKKKDVMVYCESQ